MLEDQEGRYIKFLQQAVSDVFSSRPTTFPSCKSVEPSLYKCRIGLFKFFLKIEILLLLKFKIHLKRWNFTAPVSRSLTPRGCGYMKYGHVHV